MKAIFEKYPYVIIIFVWAVIYCFHLDVLDPNIMEARNFVTAREMLTDGNWLLTTMDGLPRYEKPPLPTWKVAAFGYIFGLDNVWALRLPSALITLVMLFVMYTLSRKLTQNKGYALYTALIAATSFFIVFAGRNGTWDIFAHAFMVAGIYSLFQFFQNESNSYKYASLAGLCIGLSFMSKGPVSHYALLLPFLIAYGITYKFENFKRKWLPLLGMLVIIAVLSSWWAYYIYVNDVADATRIAEKESSRWLGYEVKPFYYYWSFFTQSGVWTIPAFVALLYPYLKNKVCNRKGYQFVLFWTLASVILLSLIPTKKSRYLLPVLMPLAFTTAFYVEYLIRVFHQKISKWERLPVYFNFGLIATIGLVFPIGGYLYFGEKLDGHYAYFILTVVLLEAVSLFMWVRLYKKKIADVFYGTILFIAIVVGAGFPLANAFTGNPTYNSIATLSKSPIPVYNLNGMAPELLWDYGTKTIRITKDELLTIDNEETFGVITGPSTDKDVLDFLKDKYTVRYDQRYDLNLVDSTKRGYKSRLTVDYYIVTKKL